MMAIHFHIFHGRIGKKYILRISGHRSQRTISILSLDMWGLLVSLVQFASWLQADQETKFTAVWGKKEFIQEMMCF